MLTVISRLFSLLFSFLLLPSFFITTASRQCLLPSVAALSAATHAPVYRVQAIPQSSPPPSQFPFFPLRSFSSWPPPLPHKRSPSHAAHSTCFLAVRLRPALAQAALRPPPSPSPRRPKPSEAQTKEPIQMRRRRRFPFLLFLSLSVQNR